MPDRLHRCRLLVGEENLAKLQHATVMVVGCGAVGSFAIEALARSGIGHIILVDFDKIEESNINRQLFATQNTLGHKKTTAARERIAAISPNILVTELDIFFDAGTLPPHASRLCHRRHRHNRVQNCTLRMVRTKWYPLYIINGRGTQNRPGPG